MSKQREIILTSEELEELKDDIKFRTKVTIMLKQLTDIPDRMTKAETKLSIQWFLIGGIIIGILSVCWKVFASGS